MNCSFCWASLDDDSKLVESAEWIFYRCPDCSRWSALTEPHDRDQKVLIPVLDKKTTTQLEWISVNGANVFFQVGAKSRSGLSKKANL